MSWTTPFSFLSKTSKQFCILFPITYRSCILLLGLLPLMCNKWTAPAARAGAAPTICNLLKCQSLAATIVEEEPELVGPFLPINKHQESSTTRERERELQRRAANDSSPAAIAVAACAATWWSECSAEKREQERMRSSCQGQRPCCLVQQCESNGSRVWVKWSSSSMYVVTFSLFISNNMNLSRLNMFIILLVKIKSYII